MPTGRAASFRQLCSIINDPGYLAQHDINCDLQVDVTDIVLVAGAWEP